MTTQPTMIVDYRLIRHHKHQDLICTLDGSATWQTTVTHMEAQNIARGVRWPDWCTNEYITMSQTLLADVAALEVNE